MSRNPPPMTLRGEVWRYALCLVFSAFAFAGVFFRYLPTGIDGPVSFGRAALDLAIGAAAFVAVHWRRRFPVAIAVALSALGVVSGSAAGPTMLAVFSVATRRRWLEIATVTVVALVASLVDYVAWEMQLSVDNFQLETGIALLVSALIYLIFVAFGMYVGSRRELLQTLVERAESAEAEQSAKVETARAEERTRIARDMHDAMAHRLSMIALHSGALSYRTDLGTQEVQESAEVIRTNTHDALIELRHSLGVLRSNGETDATEAPQPKGEDLPALVTWSRDSGMNIDDHIDLDLTEIPTPQGRALYRITQELLTNARKHAPAAKVVLELTGEAGGQIELAVSNPVRHRTSDVAYKSGFGLAGIAERARLLGGSFEADTTADRRFTAAARIPWPHEHRNNTDSGGDRR